MGFVIPLFDVDFDDTEVQAVANTVASRWISMGSNVKKLEELVAQRTGNKHAIAVSSCTAALHLALIAAGVGPESEVIVPSMTFVATANAVRYTGAKPVFCDILSDSEPTLDPNHVKSLLTPRTKAIIPMHYAGFAARLNELSSIAKAHGAMIVQDAAHAVASTYRDQHVAATGDICCFSFFSNKVITCGEGGAITTDNDKAAETMRLMRSHGMTTLSYERAKGHASEYDVVSLGYNYRLDDIRAALAIAQFAKLDNIVKKREELRRVYIEKLAPYDDIIVPFADQTTQSSHYIMPVVLKHGNAERRNAVREFMADRGIQTSVHYPCVHRFRIYTNPNVSVSLPRSESFAERILTLPLYDALSTDQITQVVQTLAEALRHL